MIKRDFLKVGLEIFSGSGHFSRSMRRRQKRVFCAEFDICHGPQFDLTKRATLFHICHLLASGQVAYVWLGTPCHSWSRARRWDGRGPGPLRDDGDYLMGLPGLSDKDQVKVDIGNCLMRASAKIFRVCLQLGIPVALENPRTSRLWKSRPIAHLLNHVQVHSDFTDFCQDGKEFRKRTRIMWAHVNLRQSMRKCSGKRGVCSRAGLRRQQLYKDLKEGNFSPCWLNHIHVLFVSLCDRWATAFHWAIMNKLSASLWRRFQGL